MSVLRPALMATILLAVPLLSGCGPRLEWTRPDTTLAQVRQDSSECAGLARDQAFRESFYYSSPFIGMPGPYRGGFGPFPYYGYRDNYMWQAQRESDLQDFCLRARGYTLTAVEP
jgi:hypothetical protein